MIAAGLFLTATLLGIWAIRRRDAREERLASRRLTDTINCRCEMVPRGRHHFSDVTVPDELPEEL